MELKSVDAGTNPNIPLSPFAKNKGGAPPSFIWKFYTKLQQNNKKTNRYRAQCNFCQHIIEDGRVENLHKHVIHVCQLVTPDVKQYVQAELDKKESEAGSASRKAIKKKHGQTPHAASSSTALPTTEKEQEELDIKLLRLLIMNNLPFGAVEGPWMLDFCHSLKPSYVPAGALKLQTTVLTQEHMKSRAALVARLAQGQDVTVSLDCWANDSHEPVYACSVAFSDGTVALLGAKELPGGADTPADVSGIIKDWITMLGPEKVGALCTNDAGNLKAVRSLVVSTEGFTHIAEYRCPVHAFSLAVCSMLGFPWAKAMVGSAQRMASCFHANSIASTLLAEEAKELGIDAQELPCNLSQVQSVHACLESLVNLELAVRQTLKKHPDLSVHHEVRELASNDNVWFQMKDLCKLLAPLACVFTSVKSRTCTMADVALDWLHLARGLQAAVAGSSLPADFLEYCCAVFNEKAGELDGGLCRLALFLDPRYKDTAVPVGSADSLISKARSVFQIRRHREEECNRLDQQLQLYLAGSPPFDQPVLQHSSVKAWWLNLGTSNPSVVEIVNLAVFLLEIVPHAASVERVSSIMGWYHTPVRSQLDVDTLARVVALKAHLQLDVPRVLKPLQPEEQHSSIGSLLLDVPTLGPNASPEQLMNQLQLFYVSTASQSEMPAVPKAELLMAAQYKLDHPTLIREGKMQDKVPVSQIVPSPCLPSINTHEFVRTCFAEMGRKH